MITGRRLSNVAAVMRRTTALAGVALLVVGLSSATLPPPWHGVPAALAEAGGNGKGNNGNGKGNGGPTGVHSDNGNGSAAKSGKEKDKQKDKDQNDNDNNEGAAAADQAGASAAGDQAGAPIGAHHFGTPAAAERSGRDFIADELVVANLGGETRAAIGRLGFAVLAERRLASLRLTIVRLRVPRQMKAPAARTLLARRYPGILVDLNALYRPQGQIVLPAPDYPAELIGWGRAPDRCGQGVRIGLLDTAVDTGTPGLSEADIVQRSFLPADAKAASMDHGSAIASILVGRHSGGGAGLLPGAELAVANVFDADPDGTPIADVVALVSGLDWLVGRGAPVINMSFAGDANAVVALALRRVMAQHAIVVAAAGNGGPTAPPTFPADEPGVIGVTAVDSRSQPYAGANRGDYIDFAAPGVRIWTPGPTSPGSYHTGTSFAVPFVTAAAAAQLANGAPADADRIVDSLAKTVIDLGPPGKDAVFGRGLIQSANPCSASASTR
jgi:hypothetical protein